MSIAIGRETSHSCAALVIGYCMPGPPVYEKQAFPKWYAGTLNCKKCTIPKRYRFFYSYHLDTSIWTRIKYYYYYYYAINAGLLHEYILQSELVCDVPSLLQSHGS